MMKESKLKVAIGGNKFIYGTLRGELKDKIVVLCHGYGGWMHEMLLFNSAREFEKYGYNTLRLSMYGGGDNSRDISESDVMTHSDDIDSVSEYLRSKGLEKVFFVGHSYSGMAIVFSKLQSFDGAALWDPTHTNGYKEPESIKNLEKDFVFVESINSYVAGIGSGYVYAKSVFDNDYPTSTEMAMHFKVPTLVINADFSSKQKEYGKKYADEIKAKTNHIVLKDTTHPFVEEGGLEKLVDETASFFDLV